MARLIYAFLALALGTLVAGFLIRDSSIPLFVSIGLSALVLVMILFGTSRRLRRDAALGGDAAELAELEIVELDEDAATKVVDVPADEEPTVAVRTRKKAPPRSRPRSMPPEPVAATDEPTIVVPERPARRRRRPAAVDETPGDETAPGPAIEIEPPPTPRPRRKARASGRPSRAPDDQTAASAPSAASSRPGAAALAPKVWVIPGRSRYHTRSCRFAKGDDLREVTEATARRRGYVPCSVCQPGQGS